MAPKESRLPKEAIHFLVARKVRAELARSPWGEALGEHEPELLAGAVFPDILYYLGGRVGPAVRFLPHWLHGGAFGEGGLGEPPAPLEIVRRQGMGAAQAPPGPERNRAAALCAGLACHVFTDGVFHPFVIHHAGDSRHPDPALRARAIRSHYSLETALDLAACGSMRVVRELDPGRVIGDLDPGRAAASAMARWLARAAGVKEEELRLGIARGFSRQVRAGRLFRRTVAAEALDNVRWGLPRRTREIAALFYSRRLSRAAADLTGMLTWLHPVTGEAGRATLEELLNRAASLAADHCRRMAPGIFAAEVACLDEGLPGPGLDTGLASGPGNPSVPVHFAQRPLVRS